MRYWLKEYRKAKGLTQEQVARGAFINRAYYSQIEQGSRNPSIEVAKGIAGVLGFNATRFFTEEGNLPFEAALKNAPIVIAHCDLNLRYTWIHNPHPAFNPKNVIGKTDSELDSNPGTMELMEVKRKVIDEGRTIRRNIVFPLADGTHIYSVFAEPLMGEDGTISGVVTASMDLTF